MRGIEKCVGNPKWPSRGTGGAEETPSSPDCTTIRIKLTTLN